MASATKDPFDQLIDACHAALDFVAARADRAGQEVSRRTDQSRRIEGALAVLTGDGPARIAAPAARVYGGKGGGRLCPKCGHGFRSNVHRGCHQGVPAEPSPLVATASA